jgi:hypothetical protein
MIQNYFTQADIESLPDEWKLLPANGNKIPVDPKTGKPLKNWPNARFAREDFQSMSPQYVKAVSVLTGFMSNLLVIDVDALKGEESFLSRFKKPVTDLPSTITNTSGKLASRKYYFTVPEQYHDKIRSTNLDKLDILWNGKQAILMGKHPQTGSYQWVPGHSPQEVALAEAPLWLLEGLSVQSSNKTKATTKRDSDWGLLDPREECPTELACARKALKDIPAAQCEDYRRWLMIGMCLHSVGDSLLPDWIKWSSQMSNFDEDECFAKWYSFSEPEKYKKQSGKEPLGIATLLSKAAMFKHDRERTTEELIKSVKERNKRIPALIEIIRRENFRYDDLKRRIEHNGEILLTDPRQYYVDLAQEIGVELSRDLVKDCLIKVAKENTFNPIREYLESVLNLAKTTQPITDKELQAWFGLGNDDAVSTGLVRVHLRACAMRGMNPGSKMDSVLILAGPMGFRKSSAIKALAPKPSYYDETTRLDLDNKDTLSAMNSAFIFELSEIEKLIMSRESSVVKAWITRQFDNYVEKYESIVTEHPRRAALWGSTNATTFLNDPTGSRRFWIGYNVAICDVDDLIANRGRLWAHSLQEALDGEPFFLKQDDPLMIEASARGSDATMSDPWLEMLPRQLEKTTSGDFLETGAVFALIDGKRLFDLINTDRVDYCEMINYAMSGRKPYDTVRLANVMQSLGWTKCRKGGRRGYLKP